MTKYAEVDGIGTPEFPDDTPDDVIDKAVMDAVQEAGALSQAQRCRCAGTSGSSTSAASLACADRSRAGGRSLRYWPKSRARSAYIRASRVDRSKQSNEKVREAI